MDINELYDWLMNVDRYLSNKQQQIAVEILKEIRTRLKFLLDVGLGYLSLDAALSAFPVVKASVSAWLRR